MYFTDNTNITANTLSMAFFMIDKYLKNYQSETIRLIKLLFKKWVFSSFKL